MPNSRSRKLNLESIDEKKIIDTCAEQVKESLKLMIKEALFEKNVQHQQEVEALRMQIIELKSSQEFICLKYDNLKAEYDRLTLAQQQHNKIYVKQRSMSQQVAESDTSKIDVIGQYGRRQNLEFKGVPVTENENVTNTVIEISKLLGVEITKSDISTAHRLATKHPKNGAASSVPPAIIARFVRRDIRNEIYNRRKTAKTIQPHQYPVPGMTKLYVNENLTQYRKKLLWKTKELTKKYHYAYLWTTNGKIFVKKNEKDKPRIIQSENDYQKLVVELHPTATEENLISK